MTKQDLLNAFNGVIESTHLWDEMANHLGALGAEIYETKYAESLAIHQRTVWNMIMDFRGYEDIEEIEFTVYEDTLHGLGNNEPFEYTNEEGEHVVLTSHEQILDLFLSPDFILHTIIKVNPRFLEFY